MFKKITTKEAGQFSKKSGLNLFLANPYCLAESGFWEKVGKEVFLYSRDVIYRNEFAFISLPKNKKFWRAAIMINLTEKDLDKIKAEGISFRLNFAIGSEYYYRTEDFVKLKSRSFRKAVRQFEKKYKFKIKENYPQKKIISFLKEWERQQKNKDLLFEAAKDFEYFCLDNYKKIGGRRLFVEVDGKLVAYCLFIKLNKNYWVGVERKVNYHYAGLSRFLLYQEALVFKDIPYFTLGLGTRDEGIERYKDSLKPFKKEKLYYVVTDDKIH